MTGVRSRFIDPAAETRLTEEIGRLRDQLDGCHGEDETRQRCAQAYLKQLIKDKESLLRLIRQRNKEAAVG